MSDSLIKNAEEFAVNLVKAAEYEQELFLNALETELKKANETESDRVEQESENAMLRKKADARLAGSKAILFAKQEIIDKAFQTAKQNILKLSDAKYFELLSKIISKHANSGDIIIFNASDKKRVPKEFLNNIKIKLSISDSTHSFSGGVVLESKSFDRNLTLEALLEQVKEQHQVEIVRMLFGE